MFSIQKIVLLLVFLLTLFSNACSQTSDDIESELNPELNLDSRLNLILDRKKIICGINGASPGISFEEPNGRYTGLDVDICRALAAALFDDPEAVEYVKLDSTRRFAALIQNQIDVLSRNTTWTLKRDGAVGIAFGPTIFYDSQAVMVRKDGTIRKLSHFQNKSICVEDGTITALNLDDKMQELDILYGKIVLKDTSNTYKPYEDEKCDGVTADRSQLIVRKSQLQNPDDHIILELEEREQISKEPLGPAVADGDSQWFDIVQWVVFALIEAEELGITQANIDQLENSKNPAIRRFLGKEGELGAGLGISNDFAKRVIKHVGNYEEIYDRNLGAKSQFKEPRGLNALWKDGGLLYSPPFR
ncbi:MAG: amino acid ABC transporter substrate-binding protein [Cyanobacteria bacterium SBLK]|nr:amino acid ABC transporter substrate-binding protein [Cyanobacteria bacterium SBLK]